MIKKLFAYLLASYSTIETGKKARLFLIAVLILIVFDIFTIPLGFLNLLNPALSGGLSAGLFIYLTTLVLLRKGKYNPAVMTILSVLTALMLVAVFTSGYLHYYQLTFYYLLFLFVTTAALLFTISILPLIILPVIAVTGISLFFFIQGYPGLSQEVYQDAMITYIMGTLIFCIVCFFYILSFRTNKQVIKLAEQEAVLNRKKADNINQLLTTNQEGLENGEKLTTASDNALGHTENNDGSLMKIPAVSPWSADPSFTSADDYRAAPAVSGSTVYVVYSTDGLPGSAHPNGYSLTPGKSITRGVNW